MLDSDRFLKRVNDGVDPVGTAWDLRVACQSAGALPAENEEYQMAALAFEKHLRKLVQDWVRSGESGSFEYPKKRRLKLGTKTHVALLRWGRENKTVPRVLPSGEIVLEYERPPATPAPGVRHDPIESIQREAVADFAELMNSPLKYSLSRCEKCSKFYFRRKLREFYYRGRGYCPNCRNSATAARRMKEKRQEEARNILAAATEAHRKWLTLSPKTQAKYETAAKYVESRIKTFGVTGKWVTRNRFRWSRQNGKG